LGLRCLLLEQSFVEFQHELPLLFWVFP
jgi:hypothetical protein